MGETKEEEQREREIKALEDIAKALKVIARLYTGVRFDE